MKNVFLTLFFIFISATSFAEEKSNTEPISSITFESVDSFSHMVIDNFEYMSSCTIKTGVQVISNGEVIMQSVTLFHIDGYTCEEFFSMIMEAF